MKSKKKNKENEKEGQILLYLVHYIIASKGLHPKDCFNIAIKLCSFLEVFPLESSPWEYHQVQVSLNCVAK